MNAPRIFAGALAGALALGCGYVGLGVSADPSLLPASWHAPEHASHRDAALIAAGRQAASALFATRYETVDADVQRMVGLSTGTFQQRYRSAGSQLATLFRQVHLERTVTIRQIAIASADDRTAHVLVAADTLAHGVISQAVPAQRGRPARTVSRPFTNPQSLRLELTMAQVGSRWLVSAVVITP